MAGKRFKGGVCAYCGNVGQTADHVLARGFFLPEDRSGLPKVSACLKCNREKSRPETYATIAIPAGSQHVEADRIRRDYVSRRIARNSRVARDLGLHRPGQWMQVNGIFQRIHALTIDSKILDQTMQYVVRGLYVHNTGHVLSPEFSVHVSMQHPEREHEIAQSFRDAYGSRVNLFRQSFGRDTFSYEMMQSVDDLGFSIWRMRWHGGVALYGQNTPPQGVDAWWAITWPNDDYLQKMAA